MELKSLYIEFYFYVNSSGIWEIFLEFSLFSLITVSMNLFDQLVIVIYD